MRHVEHRPHIDAAAEDRVGRGERRDQRLDRRGRGIDARAELREKRLGTFGGVERTRGGDLLPAHSERLVEQALRLGPCPQRRAPRLRGRLLEDGGKIGRAPDEERGGSYGENTGGGALIKKKKK